MTGKRATVYPNWTGTIYPDTSRLWESTPVVWPPIILNPCWPHCSCCHLQLGQRWCIKRHIWHWRQVSLPMMAKDLRVWLVFFPHIFDSQKGSGVFRQMKLCSHEGLQLVCHMTPHFVPTCQNLIWPNPRQHFVWPLKKDGSSSFLDCHVEDGLGDCLQLSQCSICLRKPHDCWKKLLQFLASLEKTHRVLLA